MLSACKLSFKLLTANIKPRGDAMHGLILPSPLPPLERNARGKRSHHRSPCTCSINRLLTHSCPPLPPFPSLPKPLNTHEDSEKSSSQLISSPLHFLKLTFSIVNPDKPPLTFPSDLYDSLRYSTVTSELILLRILKFELRILLPQAYLPRLISRVLPPDDQPSETELKETALYRRTHAKIVQA
jgi:hypothetical protein